VTAVGPSPRFVWLEQVRQRQARQERTRKLRAELAAARATAKKIRHAKRLAYVQQRRKR
jgi:hypothetical protein